MDKQPTCPNCSSYNVLIVFSITGTREFRYEKDRERTLESEDIDPATEENLECVDCGHICEADGIKWVEIATP